MSIRLTCPAGHAWIVPDAEAREHPGQPIYCPVCGAAAQAPDPSPGGEPVTLPVAAPKPSPGNGAFTAAAPEEADTLAPGDPWQAAVAPDREAIPGYEILAEVGRGGMGVVYRARQRSLNRVVALKMILSGAHAGEREVSRFRVEAESLARLQHPNIVQVYEVGAHDGRPFLALEFVDGTSLEKHLAGTPLPPRQAAELAEVLGRAVHAAHERGIVHRDLKPGNILLQIADCKLQIADCKSEILNLQSSIPKITDFGLAKRLDEASGGTQSGAVMGTPSYMAPEQAGGKSKEVGPAADVYALGAILYEMLTGRPPFKAATSLDTLLLVVSQEPVPPSRLQPKLPRDLETVCLKCLRKDPRQRYATALDFAEDLRRFLERKPIAARPVGLAEWGWRWCRRNPAVAALLATMVLTLLTGTAVAAYFAAEAGARAREAERQRNRADAKAAEAADNAGRAAEEALRARRHLYIAHINLAEAAWRDGHVRQVLHLLRQEQPQPGQPDARGFEWHQLYRLCDDGLPTLRHPGQALSVAFSPDGRQIASAGGAAVITWNAATGQRLQTFGGGVARQVTFSADGRLLAAARWDGTVEVWDTVTCQRRQTLRAATRSANGVAFSPDGRRIAAVSGELGQGATGGVRVWEVTSGRQVQDLKGHHGRVSGVTWSPDGRRLATGGEDATVRIWDADSGKELRSLPAPDSVNSVAWSPDGRHLAAGCGNNYLIPAQAAVWDVDSGRLVHTLAGHAALVWCVAWSPDGRRLATASGDETVRVWDAATGHQLQLLRGHATWVFGVAFSPDGQRLASAGVDGTVKFWDARSGQECRRTPYDWATGIAFSPDGGWFAAASWRGPTKRWHAATGLELNTLPGSPCLAVSPDGRQVALAGEESAVVLFDAGTGRVLQKLGGHTADGVALAFRANGRRLVAACGDLTVRSWELPSGRELPALRVGQPDDKTGLGITALSPDGRYLVVGGLDRDKVQIWDLDAGVVLRELSGFRRTHALFSFSPDGERLAVAHGTTVTVFDRATGRELHTLEGHADFIYGLAFSRDGRQLASGGQDRTVCVWDLETGQLLRTLRGHDQTVTAVAFSPDGRQLVSATYGSVYLWDGRPLTDDLRAEREAVGLLDALFAAPRSEAEAVSQIRDRPTLRDAVRQVALALAPVYAQSALEREACQRVEALAATPLLRAEILDHLRRDTTLPSAVRQKAEAYAEQYPDEPQRFNAAAWAVVRQPNLDADRYRQALRWAETACRLAPEDSNCLNTLGVAQYRAGQDRAALETLTRSNRIHSARRDGSIPADLAFLALAQDRLGHKEEARAILIRLREIAARGRWAEDPETKAFLHEAETLLGQGASSSPKTPVLPVRPTGRPEKP